MEKLHTLYSSGAVVPLPFLRAVDAAPLTLLGIDRGPPGAQGPLGAHGPAGQVGKVGGQAGSGGCVGGGCRHLAGDGSSGTAVCWGRHFFVTDCISLWVVELSC